MATSIEIPFGETALVPQAVIEREERLERLCSGAVCGHNVANSCYPLIPLPTSGYEQLVAQHFSLYQIGANEYYAFLLFPRLDRRFAPQVTKLDHPISVQLRENVYYTLTGLNYSAALLDLFLEVSVDRIVFSADYPYSSMMEARTLLASCR